MERNSLLQLQFNAWAQIVPNSMSWQRSFSNSDASAPSLTHRCLRLIMSYQCKFQWPTHVVFPAIRLISFDTSSTAQGGGGRFKNKKPIEDFGCVNHGWQSDSTAGSTNGWIVRLPIFLSIHGSIHHLSSYIICRLQSHNYNLEWSASLKFPRYATMHWVTCRPI